jgi:LysM repeat protein
MPRRRLFSRSLFPVLALVIAAVVACGGDDDDIPGQLSDPNNVPTSTPWQEAPEVVLIDPENIQPLPSSAPSGDDASPSPAAGEPGECGETYTVEAGDTTYAIADKCGVTVEGIEELNPDIDIRALTIGDTLKLPPVEPGEEQ